MAYSDRTLTAPVLGLGTGMEQLACILYFTLQGENQRYPSRANVQMGFQAIFPVLNEREGTL